jgi:hypothetical protein
MLMCSSVYPSKRLFFFFLFVSNFHLLCVVLLCIFTSWFRVVMSVMMFSSSLPLVVCRRAHVLFTLFVFASYVDGQNKLCCVFVLFSFVLYTLCFQFLWFVHFWLPLWYPLTFISYMLRFFAITQYIL